MEKKNSMFKKKIFWILFSVLMSAVIAFSLTACDKQGENEQKKASVTLSETDISMVMGQIVGIYATVENSEESVIWTSTNSSVATVENGRITALQDGETIIVGAVGDAFGMEILHVGYNASYGVGANTHRSPYGGRNWEYYSEDSFLSGKSFAAESRALVNRGIMMFTKHFILNEQEWNRYGGTVWANEQTIREIYLKSFEIGIVEGNCNGIMSSFNRLGCTWVGAHKGVLTEVLRNEWGFKGVVITDAAVGPHQTSAVAKAEAIIAGNDLWLGSGSESAWNDYKDNATVCQALRESAHRILYTRANSAAMNGVSTTSIIIELTPWYHWALTITAEWFGRLAIMCIGFAVVSFMLHGQRYDKDVNKTQRGV